MMQRNKSLVSVIHSCVHILKTLAEEAQLILWFIDGQIDKTV